MFNLALVAGGIVIVLWELIQGVKCAILAHILTILTIFIQTLTIWTQILAILAHFHHFPSSFHLPILLNHLFELETLVLEQLVHFELFGLEICSKNCINHPQIPQCRTLIVQIEIFLGNVMGIVVGREGGVVNVGRFLIQEVFYLILGC